MNIPKNEFAPFYANYISLAQSLELTSDFQNQMDSCLEFYKNIADDKLGFSYLPNKWTIKEVLIHVIDCERIFAYRALRIARNDKTPLPGFDENSFTKEVYASNRTLISILKEYTTVRNATISLFESFNEEQLLRVGIASDKTISVRAIGKIIMGHELHHIQVIKERYL
ncbi:DinB family protein [Flavobacterium sp.]|uniref:DinB family protein n=1 Tax=Flavobacterium sp. TaxID=239 RepID=UPI003F69E276